MGLIVATERDWGKFCEAIDRPDLAGHEGTTSGPERAGNMSGWLGEIINEWFAQYTRAEASEKLLAAGLPVGPVQDAKDIFEDPHVAARKLMIDVPDPVLGSVKLVGPVAKLSANPEPRTEPAPLLGEHSAEILSGELGYTPEQIAELKEQKVI